MSPKAVQYRANSIIYFKGDQSDRIFLLNSGKVSLSYVDIETGQEVRDMIKMGEFFGVKSALGRYMREETAVVQQDSTVMVFSVPEFEQLASKNTRIITKMLKVFSNQLRRIHRQVQNLMVSDEQVNPETGSTRSGNTTWPTSASGRRSTPTNATSSTTRRARTPRRRRTSSRRPRSSSPATAQACPRPARRCAGRVARPRPACALPGSCGRRPPPRLMGKPPTSAQQFYNAVSLVSQEKYLDAFKAFKKILEGGTGSRNTRRRPSSRWPSASSTSSSTTTASSRSPPSRRSSPSIPS